MPYFDNEGVKIYYETEGTGEDLFMIHGFSSNIESNWRRPNWVEALKDENRLILMDCRGHGKSDKPTDPSQYGTKMWEDITKLMDHLSIEKANFFGYSMGSRLVLNLLLREPQRVKGAVLGGFVLSLQGDEQRRLRSKSRIDALRAENADQVKNDSARSFRRRVEARGADLNALIALMMGRESEEEPTISEEALKKISVPAMTVIGSDEQASASNKTLFAKLVPGACHFQIQGRDHLTVVADPKFHMVVKAFLNYVNSQ